MALDVRALTSLGEKSSSLRWPKSFDRGNGSSRGRNGESEKGFKGGLLKSIGTGKGLGDWGRQLKILSDRDGSPNKTSAALSISV